MKRIPNPTPTKTPPTTDIREDEALRTPKKASSSAALPYPGGRRSGARFIDELFSSLPADFQGALELSTDAEGVVSLGLLQTGLVTTSLPVHHYGIWRQDQ